MRSVLKTAASTSPRLRVQHEAEQKRTAIHAVKKAEAEGPAWHYKIGELNLKDATANFHRQHHAESSETEHHAAATEGAADQRTI